MLLEYVIMIGSGAVQSEGHGISDLTYVANAVINE